MSRNRISLVGVFGSSADRRALVRLPNGRLQRVRTGDSISGTRVAAVDSDSIRLAGGGQDTVLRLPD